LAASLRQLATFALVNAPENVKLQFAIVYIAEAHAVDEWPISSSRYTEGEEVCVAQTRTLSERIEVATYALTKVGFLDANDQKSSDPDWILLAAPPEEEQEADGGSDVAHFEAEYKPWPFRAWGFINNTIDYVAEPHACEVKIDEIQDWLSKHIPLQQ